MKPSIIIACSCFFVLTVCLGRHVTLSSMFLALYPTKKVASPNVENQVCTKMLERGVRYKFWCMLSVCGACEAMSLAMYFLQVSMCSNPSVVCSNPSVFESQAFFIRFSLLSHKERSPSGPSVFFVFLIYTVPQEMMSNLFFLFLGHEPHTDTT